MSSLAMRRGLRIAALLAALAGAAACQEVQEVRPPEAAASLRARALGAEQQGDFALGAELFQQLAKLEPDQPQWVAGAARCLGRVGRFNDAMDLLEQQRPRFPGHHDLPALLARTLLLKAESDVRALDRGFYLTRAAELAQEVLAAEPGHLESALLLAQARYLQGDVAGATAAAEAATARHPDHPGSWILLGRIHADAFRTAQATGTVDDARRRELLAAARTAYGKAIALDPDRPFPHVALGNLAVATGERIAARGHFADALVADPEVSLDHAWLEGDTGADRAAFYAGVLARHAARPAADPQKTAVLRFYVGRAHYDALRFEPALAEFTACVTANPRLVNAHYYAAIAAARLDRRDDAEQHAAAYAATGAARFADLVRGLPDEARAEVTDLLRSLADRAYAEGRVPRSRDLNHVLANLTDTADAWSNWALLCRDTKQFGDSLQGYRRALEKEPDSPQLLNDMAVVLHYHMGDADSRAQARTMYQRAVAEADRIAADPAVHAVLKRRSAQARSDALANLKELDG